MQQTFLGPGHAGRADGEVFRMWSGGSRSDTGGTRPGRQSADEAAHRARNAPFRAATDFLTASHDGHVARASHT